ncbi:MAG: lamin tail domain-containing protein, partial [candidate division Zixibacteria bacterium]|nr:lamin tail domain-containing protein [candidate division Zixibacteria bacterium]
MKTIIEDNFTDGWYETRALEIQDIIDADVQADPNKFYSYSDFIDNIYYSVGSGNQSIVGISQLMEVRIEYLNNLPLFQTPAPIITEISNTPADVEPNSEVWINAEVSNANNVMLGFRHSVTLKFEKTQMLDDGNHNDGAAGDGVYGVSVQTGNTDLHYYIYAENDEAAMFSPARAEYEFYTIAVTGDIAINEFMASNDTTAADPDGDYDDWLELYNNSDNDISL